MNLETRTIKHKEVDPWGSLALAVVERAAEDVQLLRRAGVLRGWKVIDSWPIINDKSWCIDYYYSKRYQAEELQSFFTDGWCSRLMVAMEVDIDGSVIVDAFD